MKTVKTFHADVSDHRAALRRLRWREFLYAALGFADRTKDSK